MKKGNYYKLNFIDLFAEAGGLVEAFIRNFLDRRTILKVLQPNDSKW
jgi:hypothetical protein